LTLREPRHGELCHDAAGAFTEARLRYAAAVGLRQRARAEPGRTLELLDVGTGLGWNLAAALAALQGTGARLRATSLERDRELLVRVAALPRAASGFPERCHRALRTALGAALADPGRAVELVLDGRSVGELCLLLGDARASVGELPAGRFDAVFLDPFSPRVAPELWSGPFLADVARCMAPDATLATYCAAARVRLELQRAGLRVARAPRVGRKAEGTLAGRRLELGPADARLQARLARRLGREAPGGGEFQLPDEERTPPIH
jgi:chorismate dehydratase